MRHQILIPCLILLALCGLLASQPSAAKRNPLATLEKTAPEIFAMKDARELFPPSPKRIPAAPMMVVENVSDENATPEFFTTDEIVAGLTAGDAATRIAARLAAQQSGDRNFIGALQSAAETVADAKEKTTLLAAADFLILPTLTETLAGQ